MSSMAALSERLILPLIPRFNQLVHGSLESKAARSLFANKPNDAWPHKPLLICTATRTAENWSITSTLAYQLMWFAIKKATSHITTTTPAGGREGEPIATYHAGLASRGKPHPKFDLLNHLFASPPIAIFPYKISQDSTCLTSSPSHV